MSVVRNRRKGSKVAGGGGGLDANVTHLFHFDAYPYVEETGKAITASANNINTTHKKFGAGSLDLPAGYASAPLGTLSVLGSYTIDFSYKQNTTPHSSHNSQFIWVGNTAGNIRDLCLQLYNGNFYFRYRNTVGEQTLSVNISAYITIGQWHRFAVEKSGSTIRLYIDGILRWTAAVSGTLAQTTTHTLCVGNTSATGSAGNFIDEVRVSDIARYNGTNFTPETEAF